MTGVPSVYIGKIEIGLAPTPTPTPIPPTETIVKCLFPRILTGVFTPRITTDKPFPRIACLQNLYI